MGISKVLIVLNFAFYLVSIALFISIPDEVYLNLSVAVISISLSLGLALYYKNEVLKVATSYYFKKFSESFISVILIFLILGMINYLAYKNSKYIDLSHSKSNSLTHQSIKIIKSFDRKVSFQIFARKANLDKIHNLFELYRQENSKVEIIPVDIALRPDLVKKLGIDRVPTIVITIGSKKDTIFRMRELEVTNSLIKLSSSKKTVLCNLVDHGELSVLDQGAKGISVLQNYLYKSSYRILEVSMMKVKKIHADCDTVLIVGPKIDYSRASIKMLNDFFIKNKSMIAMIDPVYSEDKLLNLKSFLRSKGAVVNNNTVVDIINSVNGSKGSVPLVNKFEKGHTLSEYLVGPVFFPLISSVSAPSAISKTTKFTSLAKSGKGSWGEKTADEIVNGEFNYSDEIDDQGPLNLMAAIEDGVNKTRMIVIGNSSFISNMYSKYTGNFKLMMNSLSWLGSQGALLSFDRIDIEDTAVFISEPQVGIIFYFSVIFVPLLLLVMSGFFYYRRLKL